MQNRLKSDFTLATWNIGGGILGESHQTHGKPKLDYHAEVIKKYQPNIVCLQEAHEYDEGRIDQVNELARMTAYEHVLSIAISPSHLECNASLSLGVLSHFPIEKFSYTKFPNPDLSATGPNGEKWVLFDKGYVKATLNVHGQAIGLINAHCFPLHYFGASPTESRFAEMWEILCGDLLNFAGRMPSLAAIDLNHDSIEELLGGALDSHGYQNSFDNTPTTPKGIQQDYIILYSGAFSLRRTRATPTDADHSYCEVRVSL